MKNTAITTTFAAAALVASAAFAQQKTDDRKGMDMAKTPAVAASASTVHMGTGLVRKADPKSGLVTLAHGPVKSMKWPAMTMGFQVQDKMLFDKLVVGKKIDFEFMQGSKGYVVTSVK